MERPTYQIVKSLLNGDASCLTPECIANINAIVVGLLNNPDLTKTEVDIVDDILRISNLIYNNTDRSILVLEDGVYDLLLEKYKRYNPNFQVGAEPVSISNFQTGEDTTLEAKNDDQKTIDMCDGFQPYVDMTSFLFKDELSHRDNYGLSLFQDIPKSTVSKRIKNTSHKYPKLVGTLHKAKFTLDSEAIDKGVYNDDNVRIFERDFLCKHVQEGIVNPNNITLILELKYDGVSIEAEVTDRILSARTRGDTQQDKASDLTPILRGYTFTRASGYDITPFGMKFEAVISKHNLDKLCLEFGKQYANPRNAIIGILGNSRAAQYAKYITLVPLQTSHDNMNRQVEIEFMNKYYSTGEFLQYAIVQGNYNQVLFQVKKFVEEAESMRDMYPFMYDGVVVSYLDEDIRQKLGRKNSINEYSIAIKFNTKCKYTRCRNITYTVGSNGDITPMIEYDPVEFYGMINTKSSGHSYARFMELNLHPNDILEVEYVNDVIAYVRKADVEENRYNPYPLFQFISTCPGCGKPLYVSKSGKNVACLNLMCDGRITARMTNMLNKLGIKGFSEETIKTLGVRSFKELMLLTPNDIEVLGSVNAQNLMMALDKLKETPIPDYTLLGCLGFTGIAEGKWKLALKKISLKKLIMGSDTDIFCALSAKRGGIGSETAATIIKERKVFMDDLVYIYNMPNVVITNGDNDDVITERKVIRFSGIRDKDLEIRLSSMGHDCYDGAVTKKTDILLVPYNGFTSTKVSKANEYNKSQSRHQIRIIPLDEFKLNETAYLSEES